MTALEYKSYLKEISELINEQGGELLELDRFLSDHQYYLTNHFHLFDKLFALRENTRRLHEIFSKINKLHQTSLEIADDVAFKAFEFKVNEIKKGKPMPDDFVDC